MNLKRTLQPKLLKPALGAALAIACGLALWQMARGNWAEPWKWWVEASYDYAFLFGARPVHNTNFVLVMMDTAAYAPSALRQDRTKPWDRRLHARLLNKLADDGCAVTVMDVFLSKRREPAAVDEALAKAMRRQTNIVLAARLNEWGKGPVVDAAAPIPPADLFLAASRTNWGVAGFDQGDRGDEIIWKHWPFGQATAFENLPAVVARTIGATWDTNRLERWMRYYGERGAWPSLSYHLALEQPTNFFQNKIVFIGSIPEEPYSSTAEDDKFRTPYTRWRGHTSGGVELLITATLNLINHDWLQRYDSWVELFVILAAGILIVSALYRARPIVAVVIAVSAGLAVILAGVSLSYYSDHWFPYLVIAGGQIPVALAWRLVTAWRPSPVTRTVAFGAEAPGLEGQQGPDVPDYEIFEPHFAEGAYGKLWLARNAVGQWQAFKSVFLSKFNHNTAPYEREFNGIRRYKPIADKHPGLLRVDFVSRRRREGFFYYVMELADSMTPGWKENPALYKPRDLANVRTMTSHGRLPIPECASIGVLISEALAFLHAQQLTHRDIKPSNIIFVEGRAKLGDVGLVSDLKQPNPDNTRIGTFDYMPPEGEPLGTAQADVYSLGLVLYVISTGRDPKRFPDLSASFVEETDRAEFLGWNKILLKACNTDCKQRYATAADLFRDLVKFKSQIESSHSNSGGTKSEPKK